jgi:Fe-S-cluster containining protein
MSKMELPCNTCPHNSVCCKWGTFLSNEEVESLLKEFGVEFIFFDNDKKEYRTQTWNGRCVFWKNNGCTIHSHEFYPSVCRKFPWEDGRNPSLPMAYDATLCPEIS